MTEVLDARTYPPADDADLAPVEAVLAGGDGRDYALIGPTGRVTIPKEVHEVLVQVISAMRAGRAVTLTPASQRMTTQQAADLLGISRPTVVKLIDDGLIPCERNSTRRTVWLEDVMEYRKQQRERQLAAIAATSVDLDDDELDQAELRALMRRHVGPMPVGGPRRAGAGPPATTDGMTASWRPSSTRACSTPGCVVTCCCRSLRSGSWAPPRVHTRNASTSTLPAVRRPVAAHHHTGNPVRVLFVPANVCP